MISPIFTTIVITFGLIWIYLKFTTKNIGKDTEKYIDREIRANMVRKKSLDNLNYITIPFETLPIEPYPNEKIAELFYNLKDLSNKTIVNLTGISNTDLKFAYGAANLPLLMEYDQNFTTLCTTLYELGCEYLSLEKSAEAKSVFNAAIDLGSDISGSYTELAKLYAKEGDYPQIQRLITCAEGIKSITRDLTISKLLDILDSGTTSVTKLDGEPIDSSSDPDNILPKDILDILESVPYNFPDQT